MDCSKNIKNCNCSYEPCPRKGVCCECIAYHRAQHELPACYFYDKVERSYNRTVAAFIKDQGK